MSESTATVQNDPPLERARLQADADALRTKQHRQAAFISGAARELSDMVDDLLDLARMEAGRTTISPAWSDMFDLFAALRGMFRPIVNLSSGDLVFEKTLARYGAWVVPLQTLRRSAGRQGGLQSKPGAGSTFFVIIPFAIAGESGDEA